MCEILYLKVDIVYTVYYSLPMDITWDDDKDSWLQLNRGISFELLKPRFRCGIMLVAEITKPSPQPSPLTGLSLKAKS